MTVFPLHTMSALPATAYLRNSPSESTRNSGGSTLHTGEEGIQNSLTSEKRVVGSLLLGDRSGSSDGPELHHLVLRLFPLKLGLQYDILLIS